MNVVMLPNYIFNGEVERVPGAKQVPCLGCNAVLTATPTSLEAAGVDGGFLCKNCGEVALKHVTEPLRMPDGAGDELRAVGLGHIAEDDQRLLRWLQGRQGAN